MVELVPVEGIPCDTFLLFYHTVSRHLATEMGDPHCGVPLLLGELSLPYLYLVFTNQLVFRVVCVCAWTIIFE